MHYSRDHFDVNWYPTGFSIIEQGEVANSLYLVLSGKASVLRETAEGTQRLMARLGPGSFFGEEGLAYRKPRNAHVVAAFDLAGTGGARVLRARFSRFWGETQVARITSCVISKIK